MFDRLLSCVNKHKSLYKHQFRCREKPGTDFALMLFLDNTVATLNDDEILLSVYVALSQAYLKPFNASNEIVLKWFCINDFFTFFTVPW